MKLLADARSEVLAALDVQGPESIPVAEGRNRILAGPVVAGENVPPFANSAMDGFAVRAQDIAEVPVRLRIVEDVPAGSVPTRAVGEGEATRIMTGAPMPEGADAVVMVE